MILLAPFQYDFMQEALLTTLMIATLCALLSPYLVLKGWSLLGDAISHAILPGVVIALSLGVPFMIGAILSGVSCASLVHYLRHRTPLKEGALIGILFSGLFALGLFLHQQLGSTQNLEALLFGNMFGVERDDFWQLLFLFILVLILFFWRWRDFMLVAFDALHAAIVGLRVARLELLFLLLLTVTIVVALKIVGVLLVIALLITPGITALLLTERFGRAILLSILLSWISVYSGMVISFALDTATPPLIVLMQTLLFLLALLGKGLKTQIKTLRKSA